MDTLIKKRVCRLNQGKSSGYRTLIATNKNSTWIFIYGFAKNERSNITDQEESALKKLANDLLTMNKCQRDNAISKGELLEVDYE